MAIAVAERLRNQGIGLTVVDPRWVLPVPAQIAALASAHELGEEVAILVTDVRMPEMSGVELVQRIAASHPALKVVFLTGYADDVESSNVPLRIAPSILQKPVTNEALVEAVRAQQHRAISV